MFDCWLLDAGCWMLAAGCWLLDADLTNVGLTMRVNQRKREREEESVVFIKLNHYVSIILNL